MNAIIAMFCRKPVSKVLEDDLHDARLELITAERAADHWTSKVAELRNTIPRLEQQIISAKSKEGAHLTPV